MFRISAEIASLDCDDALAQAFDTVKRMQSEGMLDNMPGGMKLPPFVNADFLKQLPQNQKMTMLAEGLNKEKARMIPMIQNVAAASFGQVIITDYLIETAGLKDCQVRVKLDVAQINPDAVLDRMIAEDLREEDIPAILGEHYDKNLNLENIGFYMHGQPAETKEYLAVKMMSVKKTDLMQKITEFAAGRNVKLSMGNLRFFLKEQA